MRLIENTQKPVAASPRIEPGSCDKIKEPVSSEARYKTRYQKTHFLETTNSFLISKIKTKSLTVKIQKSFLFSMVSSKSI